MNRRIFVFFFFFALKGTELVTDFIFLFIDNDKHFFSGLWSFQLSICPSLIRECTSLNVRNETLCECITLQALHEDVICKKQYDTQKLVSVRHKFLGVVSFLAPELRGKNRKVHSWCISAFLMITNNSP